MVPFPYFEQQFLNFSIEVYIMAEENKMSSHNHHEHNSLVIKQGNLRWNEPRPLNEQQFYKFSNSKIAQSKHLIILLNVGLMNDIS